MSFFKKTTTLIYLKNRHIEIYDSKNGLLKKLEFAPNVYNHLQIVSIRRFNSELVAFLSHFKPQNTVVVLSEDIVTAGKSTTLSIINILKRLDWKIDAVAPINLLIPQEYGQNLTKEDIKIILQNKSLLKNSNLLHSKPSQINLSKNSLILILAIILILLTFLFFVFKNKTQILNPPTNQSTTQQLNPSMPPIIINSPVPSPIATASAVLNKEDIKINILNGSGKPGQSAKLKEKLEQEGFVDIETGNAFGNKNPISQIIFGPKITPEIKAELESILKKSLSKLESSDEAKLTKFDVVITTGKNP